MMPIGLKKIMVASSEKPKNASHKYFEFSNKSLLNMDKPKIAIQNKKAIGRQSPIIS